MHDFQHKPIYELIRGEVVESIHYGAIAVVNPSGRLIASHGNAHTVTFMRSAAKPLQALSFIEHDGPSFFSLNEREIALMCASHSGTDEHVAVLKGIQKKAGVSESDLLCGIHPVIDKPTQEDLRQRGEAPTANRHNCSGKHTGMLAYAKMLGQPIQDYINPRHPVQQIILATIADMCGMPADQIGIGIDGCSAPNFAIPLYNAALAIARLCDPENSNPPLSDRRVAACKSITTATINQPDMVGGPNSFDTRLMFSAQGQVLSKGGAEGYQILGVMPGALSLGSPGLGIAFKVSDGDLKSHTRSVSDSRGQIRPAVSVEILRQLGALSQDMLVGLEEYGPSFPVYNWRKLLVGRGQPRFQLRVASTGTSPGKIQDNQ